jgi:hypothetical protein
MKPSWLTVEYASTFLMSFCATATVAAKSAVAAPTIAMMAGAQVKAVAITGLTRTMR